LALPTTWPLLTLSLLVASVAVAQPQLLARQRQDRRASLPASPADPVLELYVAAGNLTLVVFDARLEPSSLVVDRTRFKWVEVSDHFLMLEPVADMGPGERLIVRVGFKDRALPTKVILAVSSKEEVMDGKVEVDRQANTPEALLSALAQREAELEELKARCMGGDPISLVLSGWLVKATTPVALSLPLGPATVKGMTVKESTGYPGAFSTLIALRVRNHAEQKPWVLGEARLASKSGTPLKLLSVQMNPAELAPGEEGLVAFETKTPPWIIDETFTVELVDASGQRRISFNLWAH
jgi:uncharacterized protein (TIGR02268 family)